MSDKLDEMWAALEAHKPVRLRVAKAWERMCRDRTEAAMRHAADTAYARDMVSWAAAKDAAGAMDNARAANRYAQRAIDAIKEVKP